MTGIIKVIVSFFRKGEEVAIERHRSRVPVDKEKHKGVFELKKKSNRVFIYYFFYMPGKIVCGYMRELCNSNRLTVTT